MTLSWDFPPKIPPFSLTPDEYNDPFYGFLGELLGELLRSIIASQKFNFESAAGIEADEDVSYD